MGQTLYRDHPNWLMAMEPRLAWVRLTRAQFRRLAAALGALFCLAALLLVSRMAVLKNGYRIVEQRAERERLLSQRRQLERRIREMESLAYSEEVARTRLGMVDISPNQVIHLDDPGLSAPRRAWRAVFGD